LVEESTSSLKMLVTDAKVHPYGDLNKAEKKTSLQVTTTNTEMVSDAEKIDESLQIRVDLNQHTQVHETVKVMVSLTQKLTQNP